MEKITEYKYNERRIMDNLPFAGRIKELHDNYNPDAIFFTQTSAIVPGIIWKLACKKVWPNEKQPVFLTIDVRPLKKIEDSKDHLRNESLESFLESLFLSKNKEIQDILNTTSKKFELYKIKGNVAVVDENGYCYRDCHGNRRNVIEYEDYVNHVNSSFDYIDIERTFTLKTAAFILNKLQKKHPFGSLVMMTSGTEGSYYDYSPKPFIRAQPDWKKKEGKSTDYILAKGQDRKEFLSELKNRYTSDVSSIADNLIMLNNYSSNLKEMKGGI